MSGELPAMKFNLVIYSNDDGMKLETPVFHEGVYITQMSDQGIHAHDSALLQKWLDAEVPDDIDSVIAAMDEVTDMTFAYPGIWVCGLIDHHVHKKNRWFHTKSCQKWLLTSMSKEALEKEGYYE